MKKKIKTLGENESYKNLWLLKAKIIKQAEIKQKMRKVYHRRTRKLLEKKFCSRNLIEGMNTWTDTPVR